MQLKRKLTELFNICYPPSKASSFLLHEKAILKFQKTKLHSVYVKKLKQPRDIEPRALVQ